MAQVFGVEQSEIIPDDIVKAGHISTLFDVLSGSLSPNPGEFVVDSDVTITNGLDINSGGAFIVGDVSIAGNAGFQGEVDAGSYDVGSSSPATAFGPTFTTALTTLIQNEAPQGTNNYVDGVSYNSGTDVLTLTRNGLSDLTTTIDVENITLTSTDSNVLLSSGPNYGISLNSSLTGIDDIQTTSAPLRFLVGSDTYLRFSSTHVEINEDVHLDGTLFVSGDVVANSSTPSDFRLKTDIERVTGATGIIQGMSGYKFTWTDEKDFLAGQTDYGVIAQEIKKVLPESVSERHDGFLGVDYIKIIPVLIEAIKEQQETIQKLEYKIDGILS